MLVFWLSFSTTYIFCFYMYNICTYVLYTYMYVQHIVFKSSILSFLFIIEKQTYKIRILLIILHSSDRLYTQNASTLHKSVAKMAYNSNRSKLWKEIAVMHFFKFRNIHKILSWGVQRHFNWLLTIIMTKSKNHCFTWVLSYRRHFLSKPQCFSFVWLLWLVAQFFALASTYKHWVFF